MSQAAPQTPWLLRIDRRWVYLLVLVALAVPMLLARLAPAAARRLTMPPAPLESARRLFDRVERIVREREEAERAAGAGPVAVGRGELAVDARQILGQPAAPAGEGTQAPKPGAARPAGYDKIVLLVSDFGPQTRAELMPMLECTVRHLMMRRIKFALFTNVPDGAGYCKEIPEKLARELGCEYGKDWVNLGFKPSGSILVRQMAVDLPGALKTDFQGKDVKEIPCMQGIKDAANVSLVVEITGLVGMFGRWPAFFATSKWRPDMAHGCTSVSIPDAYSDLQSGLIVGLFEGIAGAAAYNDFLEEIRAPGQPPPSAAAHLAMTSQTVAHLMVAAFVVLGNAGIAWSLLRGRRGRRAGP
jgi:hypothetical protein